MKTKKTMKTFLINLVIMLICLVSPVYCIINSIKFDQQCSGYIKQAADANTVELALDRLNIAIDYIEKNDLTSGYTSAVWKTEDENIGFWYDNLKACQHELQEGLNGTSLEKTNLLLKIRESLVDNHNGDVSLTMPSGISRYPNNLLWGIYNLFSMLLFAICLTIIICVTFDY